MKSIFINQSLIKVQENFISNYVRFGMSYNINGSRRYL